MDADDFNNEIFNTEEINDSEQKPNPQYVDDELYGDSDEDTVPPPPDDNDEEDGDIDDIDEDDEDVGEFN